MSLASAGESFPDFCSERDTGDTPESTRTVISSARLSAPKPDPPVRRIFELYAYHGHTLDSLRETLGREGIIYLRSQAAFPRSTLHRMLRDRLLNLHLLDEIEASTFSRKDTELRDRAAHLRLQLEAGDRGQSEHADLAIEAFELSQRLAEKWLTADYSAKQQILDILCLNLSLDGVSLVPTMRKPFDLLAEGLISKDTRGDKI